MSSLKEKSRVSERYRKMIFASEDSAEADHNWLITLSDLMSLLLVFFIIFFAMSRASGAKNSVVTEKAAASVPASVQKAVPAHKIESKLESIRKDIQETITALKMNDQVKIETADREIIVTLKEKVTFKTGEADILKGSQPILDALAETVKKNPSFMVDIEGHTDDQPIHTPRYPSNWELSVARAASVLKYLIVHYDLDPARFTIKGNADHHPLAPNWSEENRAQNRRVEIRMKETPGGAS